MISDTDVEKLLAENKELRRKNNNQAAVIENLVGKITDLEDELKICQRPSKEKLDLIEFVKNYKPRPVKQPNSTQTDELNTKEIAVQTEPCNVDFSLSSSIPPSTPNHFQPGPRPNNANFSVSSGNTIHPGSQQQFVFPPRYGQPMIFIDQQRMPNSMQQSINSQQVFNINPQMSQNNPRLSALLIQQNQVQQQMQQNSPPRLMHQQNRPQVMQQNQPQQMMSQNIFYQGPTQVPLMAPSMVRLSPDEINRRIHNFVRNNGNISIDDHDLIEKNTLSVYEKVDIYAAECQIKKFLKENNHSPLRLFRMSTTSQKSLNFKKADLLARQCIDWETSNCKPLPCDIPMFVRKMMTWYFVLMLIYLGSNVVISSERSILDYDKDQLYQFYQVLNFTKSLIDG